jgi:hypothetical protein
VGRIDCANVECSGSGEVEIGSSVGDKRVSFSGSGPRSGPAGAVVVAKDGDDEGYPLTGWGSLVSRVKQSSGPKTSRAWKPGKRRTA